MEEFINIKDLKFTYFLEDEDNDKKINAINGVDLDIFHGEFVSILGRNGSGKSTLAKIINALLIPTEGVCVVNGLDGRDESLRWDIRKICGMVFQNPDNQIIGTNVEEDVAFGLENIGIPTAEMRIRIDEAMKCVGIYDIRESAPHLLSGGQKQRVAVAGILAMKPECIILDEATAMLDPIGRKEVMSVVRQLNKELKITILHITHHMDEAVSSDRVIVMDDGKIVMAGKPREVFSQVDKIKRLGLDIPQITEFVTELNKLGWRFPPDILTAEEFLLFLKNEKDFRFPDSLSEMNNTELREEIERSKIKRKKPRSENCIVTKNLGYVYSAGTPFETKAISDISINIKRGSFTCIIGHTGCGKSTLIQHFNGLLKPVTGEIFINGNEISKKDLKDLRKNVGLLFQYPEYQLFEETVYKDIAFGLKKLGFTKDEIDLKVKNCAHDVGLNEELLERSIYELSGGEKRRAAIAGVLVMEPDILVFDEPTAGLDPRGRDEILSLIESYHCRKENTVIFVSHNMEDVARFADYIIVMNKGKIEMEGTPAEVFAKKGRLEEIGLTIPPITYLMGEINKSDSRVKADCFTVSDAVESIIDAAGK